MLLELLVNGAPVDALARLVAAGDAQRAGRALAARLKGLLDRQQFEVVIQVWAGVAAGWASGPVLLLGYLGVGGGIGRRRGPAEHSPDPRRPLPKTKDQPNNLPNKQTTYQTNK